MASKSAKHAAQKVLETLGKGEKVVMGKILREVGYSDNTANSPKEVTESKSYQDEISPFVQKMLDERDRIINHLKTKDLDAVQYQQLTSSLDTFTKNIQLLSGKETERQGITIQTVDYKNAE